MADCRGCGAPMVWGRNIDTGKGVPLDPDPTPDGNLVRVDDATYGREIPVRFVRKNEQLAADAQRYVSHFSTCPDAASFRSKR